MSYIISSGNKKPQWVPEPKAKSGNKKPQWVPEPKAKTAQADPAPETVVDEDKNPFFDAVKDLPGIKEQSADLGKALDEAKQAIDVAKEVAVKEGLVEPNTTTPTDATEVSEKKEEAPKVEEKKEEAPKVEEKKEEAPKVEEKKEEAPKVEEKKEEEPVVVDEVEIEIPVDIPGVANEEAKVEKEGCGISCGAAVDNGKLKSIAKLSPENRKDLAKFWKKDLGMPSEWVDAMLKDY